MLQAARAQIPQLHHRAAHSRARSQCSACPIPPSWPSFESRRIPAPLRGKLPEQATQPGRGRWRRPLAQAVRKARARAGSVCACAHTRRRTHAHTLRLPLKVLIISSHWYVCFAKWAVLVCRPLISFSSLFCAAYTSLTLSCTLSVMRFATDSVAASACLRFPSLSALSLACFDWLSLTSAESITQHSPPSHGRRPRGRRPMAGLVLPYPQPRPRRSHPTTCLPRPASSPTPRTLAVTGILLF